MKKLRISNFEPTNQGLKSQGFFGHAPVLVAPKIKARRLGFKPSHLGQQVAATAGLPEFRV